MRSAGAQMIMLLGLVTVLWLLFLYARVWTTPVALLLWLVLTCLVARGLFLGARVRRRAWLQIYLSPQSTLVGRLSGGPLMLALQFVLATALSLLLMVAVADSGNPVMWLLLIGSALLLPLLSRGIEHLLAGHANPVLLPELSWRLSSILVGIALLAAFTVLAYIQNYPDFTAVTLEQAVWHLVEQQQARSVPTLTILQGAAAVEAVRLWLAQQLLPAPAGSLWQGLGWALLLAQEALFVWSYLLACRGIVIMVSQGGEPGNTGSPHAEQI